MTLHLWRFGTIILVALLQGLAFAHFLERPAKLQYDGALYVKLQQTLYVQWGPPNVGGMLEPAAILATVVLMFLIRKYRFGFWLTAAAAVALLLAFPVVFFWLVAPANEVFLAAGPDKVPVNWMEMRQNWETGHAIRFLLQFVALALLVGTLILERHESKQISTDA